MLEENPPDGVLPLLDFDIEQAPQDCPATWALLGTGQTKGIFQLESNLGKSWTKKLKPQSEEHMSALGALLRPGCLKAVDENGVSMTQHYVLRRHEQEEVRSYHPAIDAILFPTYGVLAYQEQAMFLAVAIAGFNEQEADMLRKAIGKKLAAEMSKVRTMFLEGAKKANVVSQELAEEVFGWIEKSQRYSFNKSHSYCYGLQGYENAYIKAHHPLAFFAGWLNNAKHKADSQEEVNELVNDARLFDVVVEPPDLRNLEPHFQTDRKTITFGLADIKGIGDAQIAKLRTAIAETEAFLQKPLPQWNWLQFLVWCSDQVSSSVTAKLIEVGAMRWMGKGRQLMRAEFDAWNALTDKEKEWVRDTLTGSLFQFDDVVSILKAVGRPKKEGGGCANKNRVSAVNSQVSLLEKPPTPLVDTPHWIAWAEEELLGISITCSRVDSCDLSAVNCSCKEYMAGRTGYLMLGVEITRVHEVKTKTGKSPGSKMARLVVTDGTCAVDAVVWPETYKEVRGLLTEGNTILIQGERDKKEGTTLVIKKVWQASTA